MTWGEGLPLDIAMSIFSRLIISHLRVCRFVCKTWNAMILDYAHSSKLNNDFILSVSDVVPNPGVIVSLLCNARMYCFRSDPTKSLDAYLNLSELEGSKSAFSIPSDDGDWSRVTLMCYCNGLLFVCKSNNVKTACHGIFNPTTNEFYHVPKICYDIYHFGLGYIPSTKQYKLFRCTRSDLIVCNRQQDRQQGPITMIDVFHFGRNQWKQLHSLPYLIDDGGIYMDGVIYFLGKVKNKPNNYVIYALDVETEQMELSAILKVGPGRSYSRPQILQSYGIVYAIIYINQPTTTHSEVTQSIQVWRMQKKNSWIREFGIRELVMNGMPGSIVLIKAEEILCKFGRYIFCLYNTSTGRKEMIRKTQSKCLTGIYQIETLNFGLLGNILAGDEKENQKQTEANGDR